MQTRVLIGILIIMYTVAAILAGCENEASGDQLQNQVQSLVNNDQYDEALDLLRNADQDDDNVRVMLRDTHLHYGNHLMYHAEEMQMNERMPKALRHFRRVLEIDPDNRMARSNVDQIEGIYRQMQREIPEGVAE